MRRAILLSTVVLVMGFVSCRPAEAGVVDWILELSGPRMASLLLAGCEFDLTEPGQSKDQKQVEAPVLPPPDSVCRVYQVPVTRNGWMYTRSASVSLSIEGGVYTVWDAHESNMGHFERGSVWMFAFEPLVTRRWDSSGDVRFEQAGGLSVFVVSPNGVSTFTNAGVKAVPFTLIYRRLAFSGILRWFPEPFTSAHFGRPPKPDENTGPELVKGFQLAYRF